MTTIGLSRLAPVVAIFLPLLLQAQGPAVISVDAASSPGPVNRLVFGQNVVAGDTARLFTGDKTDLNLIETGDGFWDPQAHTPVPVILEPTRQAGVSLLRYPGGALSHTYDWRKTVGPLEARGNANWNFGLDEYLTVCRAVGAVPMITVSDYVLPADQIPANAAGLVDYLNCPATPDHPWAMKRKEWGHPDPYGVKWFELGNESAEGNNRVVPHRKYTAEDYAAYANATAAAMRAVDPSIKIGIVMTPSPGTDVECEWNRTVARRAGKSADFLIIHLYGPDISHVTTEPGFFQGCMAVGEQAARHLDDYRAMALRESGRDLSVAITEYNGPLDRARRSDRFSYGVAMECADLLRVYLQPEHHVLTASYWEFLNGIFGMLRSDGKTTGGEPAYELYRLWAQHLGTQLAAVRVDGPRASFAGAGSVYPATGDAYVPAASLGLLPTDGQLHLGTIKPGITGETGAEGNFILRLDGVTGKVYPELARLPQPAGAGSCDYDLSFEARFVPDAGNGLIPLSLGIGDLRGWTATRSAISIDGIGTEWKAFKAAYHGLPDTTAISLLGHVEPGSSKVSGKLELRGLKIEAFSAPQFPAYTLLTACATLSEDGKTLHLIVFNKSADQDIPAQLQVAGFHADSARVWEVNGPDFSASTSVGEVVHGDPLDLSGVAPSHVFPAHSMTAIDFTAQAGSQNK
jgi:alpha-L-arabinofuranosidase